MHVYYVDAKPRVFDAKIDGSWKTLLVCGLDMGGNDIDTNEDFDGDGTDELRTFKPVYFCLDITTPRSPKLLWEKSYTGLGFSSSIPAPVKVGESWFLVFGSGPTDYNGGSNLTGRIFVVDLASGALEKTLVGSEAHAFMNSPVSYDYNLNYNVDAVYFGESYFEDPDPTDGVDGTWKGKVYKVTVPCDPCDWQSGTISIMMKLPIPPRAWTLSTLFDSDGPITAPLSLSVDRLR